MKKFVITAVALFATAFSFAQNYRPCSASEMIEQEMLADPNYALVHQALEQFTQQNMQSSMMMQRTSGSILYTIPVVFHVIHNYGAENISKDQVLDAVDVMNKSFQKLYGDSVIVCSAFRPIIADCQIQFSLAQIDPQGNCTDGITRTASTLTYSASDNVKQLIDWPSNKYFNIWVVANIASGAAGYAYYPGISANKDGVVMRHDYTGSIGTAANGGNYAARSLTHEAGHWLNLPHTWGSTNSPGDPLNCNSDDGVPDTPNTIGVNNFSCDTTQVTCGSQDNVQNYMDYASCHYMFTEGQKAKMHLALNSSAGNRNQLWQQSNLVATGTNDGFVHVDCTPVADFDNKVKKICTGATVNFYDRSWNGDVTTWDWSFPGGTPATSNQKDPVVVYSTPGIYDVTLTVSNSAGSNSLTRSGVIFVSQPVAGTIPFQEGFESTAVPSATDWLVDNSAGNGWEVTSTAAQSGTKSLRLVNFSGNPSGTVDDFITPVYDFTNIVDADMTFDLAFAVKSTNSTDNLKVYVSNTCGNTWVQRYSKTGTALSTAGLSASNFVPSASQWRNESASINSFLVNNQPNVRFRFSFTRDSGNNIYIDNINITGTSTVGIQDVEFLATVNVYPNPASGAANLSFNLSQSSQVVAELMDISGRVVSVISNERLNAGQHKFSIGDGLNSGIYFVRLTVDGGQLTQKVIFTN